MSGSDRDRERAGALSADSREERLRLARIYRRSGEMGLSSEARAKILEALLRALELRSESPQPANLERCELKLRQLVQAGSHWEQLAPHAWTLLRLKPTAEIAARLTELAFLHGARSDQLCEILRTLHSEAKDFYAGVHHDVRSQLLIRLWTDNNRADCLLPFLMRKEAQNAVLTNPERLFVFAQLLRSKDMRVPFRYYEEHERALVASAQAYGPKFGFSQTKLYLLMGKVAVELGLRDKARAFFGKVKTEDPEHAEALQKLLSLGGRREKESGQKAREALTGEKDFRRRLELLASYLEETRGLGEAARQKRTVLSDLLQFPLTWLPETPEAWAGLSNILVLNRDQSQDLPNLYAVFRVNATAFHRPALDLALWSGPSGLTETDDPSDLYWRGVAFLHDYVAGGSTKESALWDAKACVAKAKTRSPMPLTYEWKDLYEAASQRVARSVDITEHERSLMLTQLRVAADVAAFAPGDVDDYLRTTAEPSWSTLVELERCSRASGEHALEGRIILRRAALSHFTNADLNRLWQLAVSLSDHDYAWRVATVLIARQAARQDLRYAWEISGEKRSDYPLLTLDRPTTDACFAGMIPLAARLAYAVRDLGASLPELLATIDHGAVALKAKSPVSGSQDEKLEKLLSRMRWLDGPKRIYQYSYEGVLLSMNEPPPFMQSVVTTPWATLALKLGERFGLGSWQWRPSRLSVQTESLMSRLALNQDLKRYSLKVARWLRELSAPQRHAWQELMQIVRQLSDDIGIIALACFVSRLATTLYQNHYQALTSLQAMRAPVAVVWDLERWILSDEYSELRKKLGTKNKVPVPNTLRKAKSLLISCERS